MRWFENALILNRINRELTQQIHKQCERERSPKTSSKKQTNNDHVYLYTGAQDSRYNTLGPFQSINQTPFLPFILIVHTSLTKHSIFFKF